MLLLTVLAGCQGVDGEVLDAPILSARLENVSLRGLTVLVGSWGGKADLVVQPVQGRELTVPVSLRGGTFGLGVELVPYETAAFGVPLVLPEGEVTGNDLIGRYSGSSAAISVVAGVESRHLKNAADVEIDAAFVPFGVSLIWGAEWVAIDPREVVLPTDTGTPPQDTGSTR